MTSTRDIWATVDGVLVVDERGRVVVANDIAASLLKRDPVGLDLGSLMAPPLARIVERPFGARVDGVLRLPTGAEVPVHLWAREDADAHGGGQRAIIFRDASEWEVARSTLSLVAAGVEHAADAFEITDAHGVIEYANSAHAALTGFPLFEALGEPLARFVEESAARQELLQAIALASTWRGEVQCRRKDGALRWQELTLSPVLDGRGLVQRFVAVRRDVTDRVEVEREAEELRAALALAEQTAVIGRLAATVAHEVNNPATSILANLSVAQDEIDQVAREIEVARVSSSPGSLGVLEEWWRRIRIDERLGALRETLADSREGTERVVHLVRDLRAMVRGGADAMSKHDVVDVSSVVRAAAQLGRAYLLGRASLAVHLDATARVRLDRNLLAQIVLAVLMQASRSIPPGEEAKNRVEVRTFQRGGDVFLVVEDSGTGIPPEDLTRLFDPFFRKLDAAHLSFTVSRDIVEAAGGEMRVESDGPGTRVIVRLPAVPEESLRQ